MIINQLMEETSRQSYLFTGSVVLADTIITSSSESLVVVLFGTDDNGVFVVEEVDLVVVAGNGFTVV